MTADLLTDLRSLGALARTSSLARRGHTRRAVERALRAGLLLPVCRGWVATREARQEAVIAVLRGGKLTGASALRTGGIWSGTDRRLHLLVPANSHRGVSAPATPIALFTPSRYSLRGVVVHWGRERAPLDGPGWRVSVIDALRCFALTENTEQTLAAIESALHEKALSRSGVPSLFGVLPRRLHPLSADLNLAAESGLETIARVRICTFVSRVETQVTIPGVGRVDLLLDGWLVVEIIGDEFHTPAGDRKRASDIVAAGYRGLFFGYEQVMFDWPACERAIREMLRYAPGALLQ